MSKLISSITLGVVILLAFLFIAAIVAANTSITQRTVQTDIIIDAPASRVWQVLTDFGAYPQWNPFMRHMSGDARPGGELSVELNSSSLSMTIHPTVLEVQPERKLSWIGRILVPGIFDGEHSLVIEPQGESRVRFVHSEKFNGILVPFSGSILKDTESSFREMNRALKERAEKV